MAFAHIDWTSDYVVFFTVMTVLALVIAVLLERVSPTRRRNRRIDQRGKHREGGELID